MERCARIRHTLRFVKALYPRIACTRLIDCIRAGVGIAWIATNAARSCRSLRARRISINPKMTTVSTVRAVAMFATVERTLPRFAQTLRLMPWQCGWRRNLLTDTKSRRVSAPAAYRLTLCVSLSQQQLHDQSYAGRPCWRNKRARAYRV